MNEEKEDLRRQVERLQGQITNLTNQVKHYVDLKSFPFTKTQ